MEHSLPIWMCLMTHGLIEMSIEIVLDMLPRVPSDEGFGESKIDPTMLT